MKHRILSIVAVSIIVFLMMGVISLVRGAEKETIYTSSCELCADIREVEIERGFIGLLKYVEYTQIPQASVVDRFEHIPREIIVYWQRLVLEAGISIGLGYLTAGVIMRIRSKQKA